MTISAEMAKHFRQVHTGGNWTVSHVREILSDISWNHATLKVYDLNTIAMLAFHINYFVDAVIPVLEGSTLDAHDKYSYLHPPIESEEQWQRLISKIMNDAEKLAELIDALPEDKLWQDFTDEKYGTYYRNIHGIIEHTHYHLGQIAILKKLIRRMEDS